VRQLETCQSLAIAFTQTAKREIGKRLIVSISHSLGEAEALGLKPGMIA